MKITIEDVAREAGVSTSTVSRVLNNNVYVNKMTRKRVKDTISRLGYSPNFTAVSLAKKSTKTIGVIICGISNPYFLKITEAIEKIIYQQGYVILLGNANGSEMERRYIDILLQRNVDGIIVVEGADQNRKNGYFDKVSKRTHLVVVNGYVNNPVYHQVSCNQIDGIKEVLDYFISLGHEDFCFIRGRAGFMYDMREQVFKEYISEKGLSLKEDHVVILPDGNEIPDIYFCRDRLVKILNEPDRPTAYYGCNDLMAFGVMEAAKQLGVDIPADISLIGNDNIPYSDFVTPKLTSLDFNSEMLGTEAATLILDIIEGRAPEEYQNIVVQTDLVKRNSCGNVKKS